MLPLFLEGMEVSATSKLSAVSTLILVLLYNIWGWSSLETGLDEEVSKVSWLATLLAVLGGERMDGEVEGCACMQLVLLVSSSWGFGGVGHSKSSSVSDKSQTLVDPCRAVEATPALAAVLKLEGTSCCCTSSLVWSLTESGWLFSFFLRIFLPSDSLCRLGVAFRGSCSLESKGLSLLTIAVLTGWGELLLLLGGVVFCDALESMGDSALAVDKSSE